MTEPIVVDLVGVFVFAVSGCLVARRSGMDVVGLFTLGAATGLAGGVFRDVVLGETPPNAFQDARYLLMPLLASVVVALAPEMIHRLRQPVQVFDAIGLGLFATAGASRAQAAGLGLVSSVTIGCVSAIGGGLVRDVLAGEVPQILSRGSRFYAIPAALGALLVVSGEQFTLRSEIVEAVAVGSTVALRLASLRFGWHAPIPRLGPRRPVE